MKLGKKPYSKRANTLIYKNYRGTTLPPIPATFGHQSLVPVADWGMLGNDTVGDCVIAGADHEVILWTTEAAKPATFTTANALADYSAITGYNPNDPNSDQGCEIVTALQYQVATGMIDAVNARHKLGAYLEVDQTNLQEVLEAAYLFSVCKIGINFPDSAMTQFNAGQPWTVVQGAQIEGGHDVEIVGYDGTWLYILTWGVVWQMSVGFFQAYCDEAWAVLSQEFLNGKGLSLEGFNMAQLQADMAALSGVTPPTPAPTLVSISISPYAGSTLQVGATQAETVVATYSDKSTANVTNQCAWGSTNATVANVTNGLITAIEAGTCVIKATFDSLEAQVNVSVEAVPVPTPSPTPVPTPVPVVQSTLVLYYGDADLQIAADLAQYYSCQIMQAVYATPAILVGYTTKYQVGGSSAPAGVTLLAGADRFATMKAVLVAMGKD